MFEVEKLVKAFGGVKALDGVSLSVKEGEIRGLIGPNGSGKTTLLNVISGLYRPDHGNIYLNGERIDNLRPNNIAMKGIGRTFQVAKIFGRMSVLENLLVPAYARRCYCSKKEIMERAQELLKFVDLDHVRNERAANLSGGQQKLLEYIRAIMLKPTLVLMDEPFAGVHAALIERMIEAINVMNERRTTFIIVSHDLPTTLSLCKKISVLVGGRVIAEGSPKELKDDYRVVEAYLGES